MILGKSHLIVPTFLAAAAFFSLPNEVGTANPGRIYRGFAKNNVVTPEIGAPTTFDKVDMKVRLPRKKGELNGVLHLVTIAPPFPANVPISGKIRKHLVRQGGAKQVYIGNWNWELSAAGFAGDARGRFKMIVRELGFRYKIRPPVRVKVEGEGPPRFTYTARFSARNHTLR